MILVHIRNVLHGNRVVVDRFDGYSHQRLRLCLAVVAIILKRIRSVEVLVGIVSYNVVGNRNRPVRGLEQIRLRNGSAEHLRGRICVETRCLIDVRIISQHRDRNRFVFVYFLCVGFWRRRVVDLGYRNRRNDIVADQTGNILNGIGDREGSVVVGNRVDDDALLVRRNRNRHVRARCRHAVDEDFLRRRVRNQVRVGVVTQHAKITHLVFRNGERIRNRRRRGVYVGYDHREFVGRFCARRVRCRDGDVRGSVPLAVWRQLQVAVAARAICQGHAVLEQNRVAALGRNGNLRRTKGAIRNVIYVVDVEQNPLNWRLLRHRIGRLPTEVDGRRVVDRFYRNRYGKRRLQCGRAVVMHGIGKRIRRTRRAKVVQARRIRDLLRVRADRRRPVRGLRYRGNRQVLGRGVRYEVYVVVRQHAEQNRRILVRRCGVVAVSRLIVHGRYRYGEFIVGRLAFRVAHRQTNGRLAKLVGRGNDLHRALRTTGVRCAVRIRNDDVRQRNQRGVRRGLVNRERVVAVLFVGHFKGDFARSVRRVLQYAGRICNVRNRRRVVIRRNRHLHGRSRREPKLVLHLILEGFRVAHLIRSFCGVGIDELIVRDARRTIGRIERGHHAVVGSDKAKQRQFVAAVSCVHIHVVVDEHILRD